MHRDVDDNGNEWVGWERYVEVWGAIAPYLEFLFLLYMCHLILLPRYADTGFETTRGPVAITACLKIPPPI